MFGASGPVKYVTGMLTRPAGHEAQKFLEVEATMYEAEARHVREQNNSVCMSMESKILAFRTWFSVSNQYTTEMIVDGYIMNIN